MRSPLPARLEEHANLAEILGVLGRVSQLRDDQLAVLADCWRDGPDTAAARDRALSPDTPLVLEVLTAFDAIDELFAEDLEGEQPYLTVPAALAQTAVRALRDALSGAYARPRLAPAAHRLLLAPWRQVFPDDESVEPDLGPQGPQLKGLLAALPRLAARCHDPGGQALFEAVASRVRQGATDEAITAGLDSAFHAAVLTSRRRAWALVRRSGIEGLTRPCPICRCVPPETPDAAVVAAACVTAACALLVADALPDATTLLLTEAATGLIPAQRAG